MSDVTTEETSDARSEESDDETADGDAGSERRLDDVDDGCGCVEVWEHLSEQRRDDDG